jgi:hypothetical protein
MRKVFFSMASLVFIAGVLAWAPPSVQAGRDDGDAYRDRGPGFLERLLQRNADDDERSERLERRDDMDEGMAGRRGRSSDDELNDDGEGRRGRGGRGDEL